MLNDLDIIDLTHTIHPQIPVWPKSQRLQITSDKKYNQGCKTEIFRFSAGMGTHMDSPAHFIPSGRSISDLGATELVRPGCIVDIRKQVEKNPDYALSLEDLIAWEKLYGKIEEDTLVIAYTGWSQYWHDEKLYCHADKENIMHFPGFSVEAAEFCLNRNVAGIGIDTFSPDPGIATDFPVHHLVLSKGKYQLENLCNLDKLPPKGAIIFALPLKVENAVEAPARVIALIPKM